MHCTTVPRGFTAERGVLLGAHNFEVGDKVWAYTCWMHTDQALAVASGEHVESCATLVFSFVGSQVTLYGGNRATVDGLLRLSMTSLLDSNSINKERLLGALGFMCSGFASMPAVSIVGTFYRALAPTFCS
jgi:hypothetical protein